MIVYDIVLIPFICVIFMKKDIRDDMEDDDKSNNEKWNGHADMMILLRIPDD